MKNAPAIIAIVRYAGIDNVAIAVDCGDPDFGFHDPMYYPLTPCCSASAKGLQDGIGCRSCHQPVPDAFGAAWTSAEDLTKGLAHFAEAR